MKWFVSLVAALLLCAAPAVAQDSLATEPELPLVLPMQFVVGIGADTPAPLNYIESVTWETMTSFAWAELTIPLKNNIVMILYTEQTMQRSDETLERPDLGVQVKIGYRLF